MTSTGDQRPILVADDDPNHRSFVAEALRTAGFLVVEAENGKVALDYLLGVKPEPTLIVLDLIMPVMSGREILSILGRYLRLSRIPVIIVSAEAATSTPPHASIVGHLIKPYRFENLRAIVEKYARAIEPARMP